MGVWEQPLGYDDILGDAARCGVTGDFRPLEVPGIGPVSARRPTPASIAALAMSVKSRDPAIGESAEDGKLAEALDQQRYLKQFIADHLAPGESERILTAAMDDDLADNVLDKTVQGIATWGTARPYVAVASLALFSAMHWRRLRSRLRGYGVLDPMALPSMHDVLDEAEDAWLESLQAANADDEKKAKAARDGLIDTLYAPLEQVKPEPEPGGRRRRKRQRLAQPPPWYDRAKAQAAFDNLGRSVGAP